MLASVPHALVKCYERISYHPHINEIKNQSFQYAVYHILKLNGYISKIKKTNTLYGIVDPCNPYQLYQKHGLDYILES
jgi:hypothetical protein